MQDQCGKWYSLRCKDQNEMAAYETIKRNLHNITYIVIRPVQIFTSNLYVMKHIKKTLKREKRLYLSCPEMIYIHDISVITEYASFYYIVSCQLNINDSMHTITFKVDMIDANIQ